MKQLLLLLCLANALTLFAKQDSETQVYELHVDSTAYWLGDKKIINFIVTIENTSGTDVCCFLEPDTTTKDTLNVIKDYFRLRKEEWSLYGLMMDGNVIHTPVICSLFIKYLSPKQQFSFIIIGEEKEYERMKRNLQILIEQIKVFKNSTIEKVAPGASSRVVIYQFDFHSNSLVLPIDLWEITLRKKIAVKKHYS
ncbi:hypothetical protein HPS57_01495 [Prevotella sp. PINT]|uniref:hypothetical protein n=1 Tax=Palleniella intestinalis TaxID=2736291 RepID=UPI0015567499|nr:hypothetical protein [Palleniella intestinalis]NPD80661.1 hypothetical protein [Palleniella intestinalis]